jgi:pimeloyl-ACP methyl ester carboxylesterase
MGSIASALFSASFYVINWRYPSTRINLSEIAQKLVTEVKNVRSEFSRIHFVTHSMGGIVLRRMLSMYQPDRMGRIVMIAPPNKGSAMARHYFRHALIEKFVGPAAVELTTEAHLNEICVQPQAETMVIAGTKDFSMTSFNSYLGKKMKLPLPNDGTVTVEETKLKTMTRFVTVHDHHSHLVNNDEVIQHIIDFLIYND